MPVKCSFCRRKYARAGPYEKHLRTAHGNLGIPQLFTIQDTPSTDCINQAERDALLPNRLTHGGEQTDSDYESDADPGGCGPDTPSDADAIVNTSLAPSQLAYHPPAGQPIGYVKGFEEELRNLSTNPWAPFPTAHGFKLASWFIESKVPKSRINEYFSSGLGDSASVSYGSMHTLENHLRLLDPYGAYLQWFDGRVDDGERTLPFFHRNILDCVKYLLRQIAYSDDFVYAPRREYDPNGQRIFAEMHTGDWWWDVQETLPPGATVVPIIGMSDQTHLSNFSGDKKAWPVYITIGNLPSAKRNKPGSMAVLLLALLPIQPKFSKSSSANELQRQINADTLQGVFKLLFEPLQEVPREGVPIDCADGKVRRCFPTLAAWIADHMENVALHGVKSNACPKCEVPPDMLGSYFQKQYPARDYATYDRLEDESQDVGACPRSGDVNITFDARGIKVGQNVFQGIQRVSAPDLHQPDLLHTVYLGLFTHMMEWVQGFLKKHDRLQVFDDAWKSLPPYPGFFVPKKAYREVTQWQGKEMRNLGRCLLAVLAVALRQPDTAQMQPFKRALACVSSLLDFSLMAQYRSHTPETIDYMEQYLNRFHSTKDVFLEFRVSKRTRAKVQNQRRELRNHRVQITQPHTKARRRQIQDEERGVENDQLMDLIHTESHFNFIKMHLLGHFREHIYQFGNIPMSSTEFGELAHKEQIKEGWRCSNKNDATQQILRSYGHHHAIRMRLLNLDSLRRHGVHISAEVVELLDTAGLNSGHTTRRRILKGHRGHVASLDDFCRVLGISCDSMYREMIRYSRQSLTTERRLPEDPAELKLFPFELRKQLEIPVLAFQETDVYDIHWARSTGTELFRNLASRNDWVWVQAAGEQMYGALRGRLPGKIMALFKIRDHRDTERVYRLAAVQMLGVLNAGRPSEFHELVTVQLRPDARSFIIVDIGTIIGLAHLIPESDRRWLVNSRIDLWTFNEIY